MSESEYLEEEEMVADNQSTDEYQEEDTTSEYQEEETPRETFVQRLRRENRELKRQLKSSENVTQSASPSDLEQIKKDLFLLKNPDMAKDYDGIQETLKKHPTLTPEQAHSIYLSEKPKESVTKKEWFNWGTSKPKPKSLAELSDSEAQSLSHADYLKYLQVTGQFTK